MDGFAPLLYQEPGEAVSDQGAASVAARPLDRLHSVVPGAL